MSVSRKLLRIYHYAANLVSWVLFAVVGIALNLVCMPLLVGGRRDRRGAAVRATIRWLFAAWCNGRTGYPLVDAAMLQLNQTGYMHNRLRMVAASFLVKDLGIDWRRGGETVVGARGAESRST